MMESNKTDMESPGSAGVSPAPTPEQRVASSSAVDSPEPTTKQQENCNGAAARRPEQGPGRFLIYLLPAWLLFLLWLLNPFSVPLVTKTVSLVELNSAQKYNIAKAARAIDGTVLKPGEEFSFNARVGPRTPQRGYRPARSYIGEDSPLTTGGGICCLSSLIYQIALETGLPVSERVAHLRTMHTVAPGLDATVWYGSCDLKFRNDSGQPLSLRCQSTGNDLTVSLMAGRFPASTSPCPLRTLVSHRGQGEILVEVFRKREGIESLVSRDLYRLSR